MENKNNSRPDSVRDNAQPTGNMSAEESHEYAKKFQEENFGRASNVGEGADASAATQETVQKQGNKTSKQ